MNKENKAAQLLMILGGRRVKKEEIVLAELDDLLVKISDGENTFELTNFGEGYYQNLDVILEFEKSYTLEFEHNNQQVFAETYIPQKREGEIVLMILGRENWRK